jgi:Mg2+-importing ATPase
VSVFVVLIRQRRSALLGLLAAATVVSYIVGEHTDAVVIAISVGLGFANEYAPSGRAQRCTTTSGTRR